MIQVPYKYKGIVQSDDCQILGRKGLRLITKINGRQWIVSDSDSVGLLRSLNLKFADIPEMK